MMSHALENYEILLKPIDFDTIIIMCLWALLFYFHFLRLDRMTVQHYSAIKKTNLALSG